MQEVKKLSEKIKNVALECLATRQMRMDKKANQTLQGVDEAAKVQNRMYYMLEQMQESQGKMFGLFPPFCKSIYAY